MAGHCRIIRSPQVALNAGVRAPACFANTEFPSVSIATAHSERAANLLRLIGANTPLGFGVALIGQFMEILEDFSLASTPFFDVR